VLENVIVSEIEIPDFKEEEKENDEMINQEEEKVEEEDETEEEENIEELKEKEEEEEEDEEEEEWVTMLQNVSDKFTKWWNAPKENAKFSSQELAFKQKLDALEAMGFKDRNMNTWLLVKHLANLEKTVAELTK